MDIGLVRTWLDAENAVTAAGRFLSWAESPDPGNPLALVEPGKGERGPATRGIGPGGLAP